MRRLLKWTAVSFLSLLLVALLICAAMAIVLNTESGTRWTLARVDALLPGELELENVEGTLWRGLAVSQLGYSDVDRRINASDVQLQIDWSRLPAGRFVLSVLNAGRIEYLTLSAPAAKAEPFELALAPLPVDIGIASGRIERLYLVRGEATTEVLDVSLDGARLDGSKVRVNAVSASTAAIAVSVRNLQSELAGSVATRAKVSWKLLDDSLSGRGSFSGSLETLRFEQRVAGRYPASVVGSLQLLHRTEPRVDAIVSWESWSFSDYVLNTGEVKIRGTTGSYDADYAADLQLPTGQRLQLSGTAAGDTTGLTTFAASLRNPDGNADLSGSLAWSPEFTANASVVVSDFDPRIVMDALSGDLNAQANVTITGSESIAIRDLAVGGTLNGAAILAGGDLEYAAPQLRCDACRVAIGDNELRLDGTAADSSLGLTLTVNAPSLDVLWPDLAGSIAGNGRLSGSPADPVFAGELQGQQLHFQDWSADRLVLQGRGSALGALDVSAIVTAMARGDVDLGSGTLRSRGRPEQLDLDIDWAVREIKIVAAGKVNRGADSIDGTIWRAAVTEPNTGTWTLADAFAFRYDASGLNIDAHRWSGTEGELRIERATASGEELALLASLDALPLQMANPFLPPNFRLRGFLTANLDLTRRDGVWSGNMSWTQTDTVLTVLEAYDESTDVRISRAELSAELRDGGATATAALTIEPGVTANLDLRLDTIAADGELAAELRLQGEEWAWVSAVVPVVDNIAGSIAASISANGPLQAPEFSGELTWRNGRVVVPALNVPVEKIELVVSGASAGAATLQGSASAGDGTLGVQGEFVDLMQASRSARIVLTGAGAELINWPEYRIWASPDLVITGNRQGWSATGRLLVPRADVVYREAPLDAVTISEDVVVVGAEEAPEPPTRYSGDAELVLGDRVHLQALGLDTRLAGSLRVRQRVDRPLTATGKVELLDGFFEAYGQKLIIQKGTLTFTGPLDNPIVEVRAVRIIETLSGTVTAGIVVRGRAQNLTSSVFAEPAMSEADALSYLVIGRPLSQATASEGNELSGAALSLGLKQATRLTEQIGQAIGLDQLSLTGDGGETTALVAGKQVNPRIYARYSFGVFSRLGTLLLRYKLSRRLSLEAGTGEVQSLELLYSVETD